MTLCMTLFDLFVKTDNLLLKGLREGLGGLNKASTDNSFLKNRSDVEVKVLNQLTLQFFRPSTVDFFDIQFMTEQNKLSQEI